MKKINNNKITIVGILLIGIPLFYYFIIAPIIADSKLQNCIEKADKLPHCVESGSKTLSGSGRIFRSNTSHCREKESDLCAKLYKK
tara:strand:- start:333 stop:590 length:258 start_codon:yes stop_codon:yes gene_type:complete